VLQDLRVVVLQTHLLNRHAVPHVHPHHDVLYCSSLHHIYVRLYFSEHARRGPVEYRHGPHVYRRADILHLSRCCEHNIGLRDCRHGPAQNMAAAFRPEAQIGPMRTSASRRFVSTDRRRHGSLSVQILTAVPSSIVAGIMRVILLKDLDMTDPTCELKRLRGVAKVMTPGASSTVDHSPDTLAPVWLWASLEYVLYIICACLPVCYSLFRTKFRREPAGSSKRSLNGKGSHQIVTIGSWGRNIKKHDVQDELTVGDGFDYHIICETSNTEESHAMRPLDPVCVRSDVSVTRV
jgi:hypothetical protein